MRLFKEHLNFCTVVALDSANWIYLTNSNEYFKDYSKIYSKKFDLVSLICFTLMLVTKSKNTNSFFDSQIIF